MQKVGCSRPSKEETGVVKASISKKSKSETSFAAHAKRAELVPAEIRAAEKLVKQALRPRALPFYSAEERLVLAILVANLSLVQRSRGMKSKGAAKEQAERRRNHVNLLLYVIEERYRQKPNTNATIMKIVDWLDKIGIEASEPQVRRDIQAALKLGPLPTW
jgi:hypothetical protein